MHSGRKHFSHLVIKWTTKGNKHHQEIYGWKHTSLGWIWNFIQPKAGH